MWAENSATGVSRPLRPAMSSWRVGSRVTARSPWSAWKAPASMAPASPGSLTVDGVHVVEVDRPDRKARRFDGKSDPLDAYAAARAALSERATGAPKSRDGNVEM